MKNSHHIRQAQCKKGFALPLLLIIIAVLLIGGGTYVYEKNKQASQPVTVTGPVGISLPSNCKVVGSKGTVNPSNKIALGENEWLINCGSVSNGNARATMEPILKQQGWTFCESGLAGASWWKDGITTSIGEGSASEAFPFSLNQAKSTISCSAVQTSNSQTADWKIYTNTKYGFSFKYPSSWFLRETPDKNIVDFSKSELTVNDPKGLKKIFLSLYISDLILGKEGSGYKVTPQDYFSAYYSGTRSNVSSSRWITIEGRPVYYEQDIKTDSRILIDDYSYLLFTNDKILILKVHPGVLLNSITGPWQPTTYEQKDDDLIKQVIGTLSFSDKSVKFINAGSGSAVSASATSTDSTTPYIGSISPSSASVGTTIEIRGSSLVGFEGDVYFFFRRSDGKITRLPGVVSTQTTGDAIGAQTARVILKEPCQQGQTVYGDYSGIPAQCDYVQLTPGLYKVYTTPWGKKSNEVSFTVAAQ